MAIHNALVTVATETTYRVPVEADDVSGARAWLDKQLEDADVTELEGCVQVSNYPEWISDEIWFEKAEANLPADIEGETFYCEGCGRDELTCSKDPCPDVIADREA